MPEINPWLVPQLEDYQFFCCPECDEKCHFKEDFFKHAISKHPKAQVLIEVKVKIEVLNEVELQNCQNKVQNYENDSEIEVKNDHSENELEFEVENEVQNYQNEVQNYQTEVQNYQNESENEDFDNFSDEDFIPDAEELEKIEKIGEKPEISKLQDSSHFQCYYCSNIFEASKIEAHIRKEHFRFTEDFFGPLRPFKCQLCGFALEKDPKNCVHVCLPEKRRRKPGEKKEKLECPECGKIYTSRFCLFFHVASIHTEERKCKICERKFDSW